ncbi:serine protease [Rhodococcus sp. WS4]|nr:serine protease [Rhodococcus sp. WS4]
MKKLFLLLAGMLVSIVLAPTAHAASGISVGPGTAYTTNPAVEGFCTLAAVGNDDAGRLVALSVGHCHQKAGTPIYKIGEADKGPIGWETDVWSANPEGVFDALDYAVILLDPTVVDASKFGSDSDIVVNAVGDAAPWDVACKLGPASGKTCGVIGKLDGIHLQNWALMRPGDSGGPLLVGDKLVGVSIGMDATPEAPFIFGKITPILADIDAKGSYGAGFTPVR